MLVSFWLHHFVRFFENAEAIAAVLFFNSHRWPTGEAPLLRPTGPVEQSPQRFAMGSAVFVSLLRLHWLGVFWVPGHGGPKPIPCGKLLDCTCRLHSAPSTFRWPPEMWAGGSDAVRVERSSGMLR